MLSKDGGVWVVVDVLGFAGRRGGSACGDSGLSCGKVELISGR